MSPDRPARAAALFGLGAVLSACAGADDFPPLEFDPPDTAVEYEVELEGAPSEEIADLLVESLTLYRQQEDGAQSLAFLRRRAREDVETVEQVLRSFGYYAPEIDIAVIEPDAVAAGPDVEAMPEDADLAEEEELAEEAIPLARVVVGIEPGPVFELARHDFVLTEFGPFAPELPPADALGSPVGGPAIARAILDAEAAAVSRLRREGRPYSQFVERDAAADLEAADIFVESEIFAGPPVAFGELTFVGLEDVEADYLRTYRDFEVGAPWDSLEAREYQQELIATNLFNVVRVTPPEEPPEAPLLAGEAPVVAPVVVTVEERPFRTVSAGVRYSTDEGPAVRGAFEHRNLFGENETFYAEATFSGAVSAAGLEDQLGDQLGDGLEATLELAYREPQYLQPDQDLILGFNARHIEDEAFDETAATLTAGIERQLTDQLFAGAGGLLEYARVKDDGAETTYYLGGLPTFLRYDSTNDVLNPTDGYRWRVEATPFAGFSNDDETPLFARLDSYGSAYFGLDDEDDYVLAGRARVGSILTADEDAVPRSRRFYSGGGGSIRGYAERSIGPLDADGDPEGGLSVVELVGEARAILYGDLGGVVFAGAGAVGEDSYPSFEDPQYAAGAGVRYYSPVGPIRLDVAFPLNPRDEDEAWQLYVSIGQAF